MTHNLVLILNCGSSSLKFAIIDPVSEVCHLTGLAECLHLADARIKWENKEGKQKATLAANSDHADALDFLVHSILKGHDDLLDNIVGVGHRVVHGGEKLTQSLLVNQEVIADVEKAAKFAPLHNPAGLQGIEAAFKELPHLAQKNVAVFDTSFHQTMPEESYLYAIPYKFYQEYGVRRYGFHGTSHYYVSQKAAALLGKDYATFNAITCHLGNGSSITAVVNGKSVDTSMGLTPLEGLVMGTRSGDIDPSIVFFLANTLGLGLEKTETILNKESGILGLTQQTSDCRFLEDNLTTDAGAQRTIKVMVNRLAKYISAYSSHLDGRLDALVFTGGIGENSALIRKLVVAKLKLLGLAVDESKNQQMCLGKCGAISSVDSVPILVIPTNEELVIARETFKLIQSQ